MRRAQLAFLLFNVAEPATWIAILVYAYDRGGTAATGLVGLLLMVPAGVVAPIAASLGDRMRRERWVTFGYAAQALTIGSTAATMLAGAPDAVVYGAATVAMAAFTATRPGHHSLLPSLSRSPDELTAGNAVSSLAEGTGGTAGTVTVTLLLAVADAGTVYVVMAVVLGLAALAASRVRAPEAPPVHGTFRPWTLTADAVRAVVTIVRTPGPRVLLFLAAGLTFVWGVFDVLIVSLAIDGLEIGDPGVGALHTAIGIGAFAGAAGSMLLVGRSRLVPVLVLAVVLLGAGAAGAGAVETVGVAIVACLVTGAGVTVFDVTGRTLLQRAVDDSLLTRVFGAVEALWMIGVGVGAALAALLESRVGLAWSFAVTGAALPLLTLLAAPALRRLDASAIVPERQLALLRAIPMFAPLPPTDLERVARQLDRIFVAAGDLVIRQGDVGDRFYVADEGTFTIEVDGQPLKERGPGDYFGEIALLHDVPRTATVRALTDGVVWALDQEEFLATVTGLPQAVSAAHAVSAERLRASGYEVPGG
jgi:MFS family permease